MRTPARRPSEDEALFRTVLLGLLVSTAEACGGFDWDDDSFDRAYAELERSLFGERRTYAAVAPLVGISVSTQLELAPGLRVRAVADGELARHWPEASSLVPQDFGRETDRYCVIELRAALAAAEDPPDAPAEIADAVSAIRLATAAPLSAGPVLFETLDGRPFGIRPVLPIAATQPPGEATRLDSFRGALAAELLAPARARRRRQRARRGARPLGAVAVPERAVPLRAAPRGLRRAARRDVAAAGGGPARDRARRRDRRSTRSWPRSPAGTPARRAVADAARRALVETLRHGDRPALLRELDEALLGVRERRPLHVAA